MSCDPTIATTCPKGGVLCNLKANRDERERNHRRKGRCFVDYRHGFATVGIARHRNEEIRMKVDNKSAASGLE